MESPPLAHRLACFVRNKTRAGEKLASAWHRWMPPIPISKRFYGLKVCLNLRDGLLWLGSSAKAVEDGERFHEMLAGVKGMVWDVGCNVGLFSLLAASRGFKVVAFDISPVAIDLVQRSAQANRLNLETVCRAFSAAPYSYVPPQNADTRNAPDRKAVGNTVESIPFSEAEAKFGIPAFIKVDIEHHEVALLESAAFKNWIKTNHISLLVELHHPDYMKLVWADIEHCMFDSGHVLFNPTPEHKAAIAASSQRV